MHTACRHSLGNRMPALPEPPPLAMLDIKLLLSYLWSVSTPCGVGGREEIPACKRCKTFVKYFVKFLKRCAQAPSLHALQHMYLITHAEAACQGSALHAA